MPLGLKAGATYQRLMTRIFKPLIAIKRYLTKPPILSSPKAGEELHMYLTISKYVVSVVLFQHVQNGEQKLGYYVCKGLVNAKTCYSQVKQTTLALRVATKKLCPCFQAHQVTILTNQSLRVTLHNLDLSRWIMKWAIKLNEYDIQYKPRLSLKRQVLPDFILELPQKWMQANTNEQC